MANFRVTRTAINGFNKEEIFEAADYFIKDGWVHLTVGANQHAIASLREKDVLRIDSVAS